MEGAIEYEKNISAEENSSEEGAWLPEENGHIQW